MGGNAEIMTEAYEGKCPQCNGWFDVEWFDELPPGGFWWKDSGLCPGCGYTALVETECDFRKKGDVQMTWKDPWEGREPKVGDLVTVRSTGSPGVIKEISTIQKNKDIRVRYPVSWGHTSGWYSKGNLVPRREYGSE